MQASERPRERLERLGAQALSDAELLAILLRVGVEGESAVTVGQRLLHDLKGLEGIRRASFEEVCSQHGLGPAKAAQIKAALELGYRARARGEQKPLIQSPQEAAELVQHELELLEQEELHVILLDVRNRLIAREMVYRGSLSAAQARIGELFKSAIRSNAAHVILVHNHPSGDPTPSPDDVAFTRAVVQAGKLLDIEVLDHLVIGRGRHVSLKERGLGFNTG
ncbi:MAG: DNA repair protein RadC [Chloroflexi bacterium]|nr:DNA repair protein RadC [Chloroflexota bacterium]